MATYKRHSYLIEAFCWKKDPIPKWFLYEATKVNGKWILSNSSDERIREVNEGDYIIQKHNSIDICCADVFNYDYYKIDTPKTVFYSFSVLENGIPKPRMVEGVAGEEDKIRQAFPNAFLIRAHETIFD